MNKTLTARRYSHLMIVVVLGACDGSQGPAGPGGTMGTQGVPGPQGAPGTGVTGGPADTILTSDGSGGTTWKSTARLTDLSVTTGRVGIGVAAPQTKLDIATENADDVLQLRRYTSNSNAVKVDFAKAFGTIAAPLAVGAGTNIFSLIGYGYDGTTFNNVGTLTMQVDSGGAAGALPGRFRVFAADATGVLRERFRVDSVGHLSSPTDVAPAVSACGTTAAVAGTDAAGTLTEGSGAAGCILTFAASYGATVPHCTVTARAGLPFSYVVTASTITITNIGALSGTDLDYTCIGS